MPQLVHDLASAFQIITFIVTALVFVAGYVFRRDIADILTALRSSMGKPVVRQMPGQRPLTATEIEQKCGIILAEDMDVESLRERLLSELAQIGAITPVPDTAAGTSYSLDWALFFRKCDRQVWDMSASQVASRLMGQIEYIAVVPWPRSVANNSYMSFTRPLVTALGGEASIVVDHFLEKRVAMKDPQPTFTDAKDRGTLVFQPFNIGDTYPQQVCDFLTGVHGCDIKAILSFFRVVPPSASPPSTPSWLEIDLFTIDLGLLGGTT